MRGCKFTVKCILAALPAIALIAYTLLCPLCYMDEEFPAWDYMQNVSAGREYDGDSFDTVILGDSGAMSSIIPDMVEGSCVNLAVGGATSIEMYYCFETYLQNHEAPDTAVIMFAPFHYWHIDNYETRTLYFRAIPAGKLYGLYSDAKGCGASSVYKDGFVTDEISARLGLPNKYLPAIKAAGLAGRYFDNSFAYGDLVSSYGYGSFGKLSGCYDESYETSYEDMVIDGDAKLITLYMQRLLKLCNEHNIHVRILQPAVNTATYEGLNEHYYGSYRNYIKEISQVADDVEFETDLRVYDGRYFADTSHLTREGAEKFTQEAF